MPMLMKVDCNISMYFYKLYIWKNPLILVITLINHCIQSYYLNSLKKKIQYLSVLAISTKNIKLIKFYKFANS